MPHCMALEVCFMLKAFVLWLIKDHSKAEVTYRSLLVLVFKAEVALRSSVVSVLFMLNHHTNAISSIRRKEFEAIVQAQVVMRMSSLFKVVVVYRTLPLTALAITFIRLVEAIRCE